MPAITIVGEASRKLVTAGWNSVPHIPDNVQAELLADTPPWLREARSQGIPSLGVGAIYPIARKDVEVAPFAIPRHWPRCYALDVGWNWTAALWTAYDRETATKYLYSCYKGGEQFPAVHAAAIQARGKWMPGLIDPAANNRGQRDGERIMEDYTNAGLHLTKANNAVEAGLIQCWQDLTLGRIKIFSIGMDPFWFEYGLYHRDEKGKIVKKNDHLMDCKRYISNSGADVWTVAPASEGLSIINAAPIGPGGY